MKRRKARTINSEKDPNKKIKIEESSPDISNIVKEGTWAEIDQDTVTSSSNTTVYRVYSTAGVFGEQKISFKEKIRDKKIILID